jgi:hypothetical protein
MEWHLRSGYPCYLAEASRKMRLYPPPQNGLYYTPWLWLDGRQRGSGYSSWASYVAAQLVVPADIAIAITGSYNPGAREGEAVIEFTNPLAESLSATANVVIIEDSVYYSAPNGDPWHNHVCRDFIPDEYGTVVTLPGMGSDTLVVPYVIDPAWNDAFCKVLVFLQSTEVQTDSTRPVYQGGEVQVLALTGANEPPQPRSALDASCGPNPARDRAGFRFQAEPGTRYALGLFSPDGRLVRELSGVSRAGLVELEWNRTDADGNRVRRGVYAWRLTAGGAAATGKLVLTD